MRFSVGGVFAVIALVVAVAPASHAAKCTDLGPAVAAVQSVPCNQSRGGFVKGAKAALKDAGIKGGCKAAAMKQLINGSTCGLSEAVVCCGESKSGKPIALIGKKGKCKKKGTEACAGSPFTNVLQGCRDGGCATTTTTTTSSTTTTTSGQLTTTTTTSTTTTTTIPACGDGTINQGSEQCDPPGQACGSGGFTCTAECLCPECDPSSAFGSFDFTTVPGTGACGQVYDNVDGTGTPVAQLMCGGLNIGGGKAIVPEGPVPDGATNRFGLCCKGDTCDLLPNTATGPGIDCTGKDCNFGPPLVIVGSPSTCVVNTLAQPARGVLNRVTGGATLELDLISTIYLSPNQPNPCPRCMADPLNEIVAVGSPDAPATGTCEPDRGAARGAPCTTYNSAGLSKDCQPDPNADGPFSESLLGPISVTLGSPTRPLTTGTVTKSAADGILCPEVGQTIDQAGCFTTDTNDLDTVIDCKRIDAQGKPALAPVGTGAPFDITFASIFCIPLTSSDIVNQAANLAGPGEVTLPGKGKFNPR